MSIFRTVQINPTTFRIDDWNTDAIAYNPPEQWFGQSNADTAFQKTMTITRGMNNSATVTFVGSKVSVFGIIGLINPPNAPHISSYSLDKTAAKTVTFPPSAASFKSIKFYESEDLPHGQHTLKVTNGHAESYLMIDYFEVVDGSGSMR
ncbi:hypothetical protein CVT24_007491 [Panaeolus cyanescens]|uniref:Gylcosyl hydrolase 115 C-terminal domain-containing protein n=1 Tax=Panaeolus cyanescens TaxID=181874 RepID=A0A409YMJ2_9AGAR|nr:hypothetical protein CVT24_007491 [Panaeolus cyanescens]